LLGNDAGLNLAEGHDLFALLQWASVTEFTTTAFQVAELMNRLTGTASDTIQGSDAFLAAHHLFPVLVVGTSLQFIAALMNLLGAFHLVDADHGDTHRVENASLLQFGLNALGAAVADEFLALSGILCLLLEVDWHASAAEHAHDPFLAAFVLHTNAHFPLSAA